MLGWFNAEVVRASLSKRESSLRVGGEGDREDLDRHVARELRVSSPVNLGHSAGAQKSEDLVRAEPRPGVERHLRALAPSSERVEPDCLQDPQGQRRRARSSRCRGWRAARPYADFRPAR